METTLETLISRGAVDGRLLTLLQQSLPDRLDDVPDGFRLTARDVVVDGRSLRLTTPITRGEGNAVADWGQLMLRVLAVSSVKPRRLRRIARRLRRIARACADGAITDSATLRLALERNEGGNVHFWVVAVVVALLSLLVWINNM